jgi:hypothetical protein
MQKILHRMTDLVLFSNFVNFRLLITNYFPSVSYDDHDKLSLNRLVRLLTSERKDLTVDTIRIMAQNRK